MYNDYCNVCKMPIPPAISLATHYKYMHGVNSKGLLSKILKGTASIPRSNNKAPNLPRGRGKHAQKSEASSKQENLKKITFVVEPVPLPDPDIDENTNTDESLTDSVKVNYSYTSSVQSKSSMTMSSQDLDSDSDSSEVEEAEDKEDEVEKKKFLRCYECDKMIERDLYIPHLVAHDHERAKHRKDDLEGTLDPEEEIRYEREIAQRDERRERRFLYKNPNDPRRFGRDAILVCPGCSKYFYLMSEFADHTDNCKRYIELKNAEAENQRKQRETEDDLASSSS